LYFEIGTRGVDTTKRSAANTCVTFLSLSDVTLGARVVKVQQKPDLADELTQGIS